MRAEDSFTVKSVDGTERSVSVTIEGQTDVVIPVSRVLPAKLSFENSSGVYNDYKIDDWNIFGDISNYRFLIEAKFWDATEGESSICFNVSDNFPSNIDIKELGFNQEDTTFGAHNGIFSGAILQSNETFSFGNYHQITLDYWTGGYAEIDLYLYLGDQLIHQFSNEDFAKGSETYSYGWQTVVADLDDGLFSSLDEGKISIIAANAERTQGTIYIDNLQFIA